MYQHLPSPVKFREDINGLRAWAVIAVLLFHFSLVGLPGGFAGVDVFFVISGYLMTAIIVRGHEKGNFSIWKFYIARARRIFPALMVLIITLLVLGWFWLPTPDYQSLGNQSIYGLSFLSNIYYWRSAGYFDSSSHEKWLLHTWSLAIEAQFYVLYPIFIAIVWRLWKEVKAITLGLLLLFIASLILNLVMVGWKPSTAFYLLPTRGWELAAGGLVYLISRQNWINPILKNSGFWLGWFLVIGSFVLIEESFTWPGYWAVFPVLGASLIILGQRESCFLTDNIVSQWLGDRSYSLYLWHWPLVVALYFVSLQNDWIWVTGAFALSIVLAHLSYQLIEVPTRQYLTKSKLFKEILLIGLAGAVIGTFAFTVKQLVFDGRVEKTIEDIAFESKNMHPRRDECHTPAKGKHGSPSCEFGEFTDTGILLIGDSHAVSSVNPATIASQKYNLNTKLWSFSACPTIRGIYTKKKKDLCAQSTTWILNKLRTEKTKNIVIVNSPHYFINNSFSNTWLTDQFNKTNESEIINAYVETVCEISESSQTYLVRPFPIMNISVPHKLSRELLIKGKVDDLKVPIKTYFKENDFFWKMQNIASKKCAVKVLNPLPYLCDDKYCYGSKNGRPLYYDNNHLSEYGNKLLVPMFEDVFKFNK